MTTTPGSPTDRPIRSRRRRLAAGVVVILLLGAGAIMVVAWQRQHDQIAVPPTEQGSWRAEQYRDITFEVPADWGYDFETGPDWCVESQQGGGPERRSYVALGPRPLVLGIDCGGPMPDDLIVEHVTVLEPAEAHDYPSGQQADGRTRLGRGFWQVTRTIGTIQLRAVSRSSDLAQRIADSAAPAGDDALCPPSSPMHARPEPSDVTDYDPIDRLVLCQFEGHSLRAATSVAGAEAQHLVDAIADRPVEPDDADCSGHDRRGLDLSVVIRAESDQRSQEIFLRLDSCPDSSFYSGGFDDGTNVRTPDRATCQSVVRPPLLMQGGGETAYKLCARTR